MVTGGTDEGEVLNEDEEWRSGEDGEAKDTSDFDTSNEDTAPLRMRTPPPTLGKN